MSPAEPLPQAEFWRDRRVLLTGHTGFKGAWLTCWLQQLGARVMGVSLPEPPSTPSLWEQLGPPEVAEVRADIAGRDWVAPAREFAPEVVLHLAAQPLVAVGYEAPAATFETNVLGTVRVLEFVSDTPSVEVALIITTDKVYDPGPGAPYDETKPLGGREPYSASKAAAEIVVAGWPRTSAILATARAGNVIGGGDWARDRLIPDLVRDWGQGRPSRLRNPNGVRPWQHVLEPLRGYLVFTEALAAGRTTTSALNFGPSYAQSVPVIDLVRHAAQRWSDLGNPLPEPAFEVQEGVKYVETAELTLDSDRARQVLGWSSVLDWRASVDLALDWYIEQRHSTPPRDLVVKQLAAYTSMFRELS